MRYSIESPPLKREKEGLQGSVQDVELVGNGKQMEGEKKDSSLLDLRRSNSKVLNR